MSLGGASAGPALAPARDRQERKLKVTLIGSLPPIKGVSPYTSHLLESLAADPGLEIEFIGFRSIYPKWFYPGGDPVDRSQGTSQYPGVAVRNVLAWYNPLSWIWAGLTLKGDVVHAQWWSYILAPIYATVLAIARLRGRRIVLTLHNIDPHERSWWKRALNRAVFSLGDWFIVHTQEGRESLRRSYGRAADATTVVKHGILRPDSLEVTSTAEAKRRLGVPQGHRIILNFGQIRPYKGVGDLLRALPDVVEACPSTTLVIAGKPWKDCTPVEELVEELGIRPHVRLYLDFVPAAEVELYFAAADVVVLPYTHFDAQSSVGALALYFRKPLIVSSVGGLPDLVLDPRSVVPPQDPRALAAAITNVLSDEVLRRKLSADADEVAASFAWEPIAEQTTNLYRSLTPTPRARRAGDSPSNSSGR